MHLRVQRVGWLVMGAISWLAFRLTIQSVIGAIFAVCGMIDWRFYCSEKDAAWQRKQQLKADYVGALARRRQERIDQQAADKAYEDKKLKEQAAINAASDAVIDKRLENVERLAERQVPYFRSHHFN